jgi:hypothetical protein
VFRRRKKPPKVPSESVDVELLLAQPSETLTTGNRVVLAQLGKRHRAPWLSGLNDAELARVRRYGMLGAFVCGCLLLVATNAPPAVWLLVLGGSAVVAVFLAAVHREGQSRRIQAKLAELRAIRELMAEARPAVHEDDDS